MDLLVANSTDKENRTDTVSWYRNDGATTPSFGAAQVVGTSLSFKWWSTTHAAYATDLDADGDVDILVADLEQVKNCLLYTSPSPRDQRGSRMPSSA